MKIWNVPIEPYEERYTAQWYKWIPDGMKELGLDYEIIDGTQLTKTIETGQVLDVYGTHYYKYYQLMVITKLIRNGRIEDDDILFFHDLWFPGIEGLQYIRDMTGKKFKIYGILHAGTWDENDFTYKNGMRSWGRYIEQGWLRFFDKVFLGSEYHKKIIEDNTEGITAELIVTGLFFEQTDVVKRIEVKENIIVFPHRLDPEKRPDLFLRLGSIMSEEYPNWKWIRSKDCCQTKEAYYRLLSQSKIAISFAEQETFGYAMLEAIANGCISIVPDELSYGTMEIYHSKYQDFSDCVEMVKSIMKATEKEQWQGDFRMDQYLREYQTVNVLRRMFNV